VLGGRDMVEHAVDVDEIHRFFLLKLARRAETHAGASVSVGGDLERIIGYVDADNPAVGERPAKKGDMIADPASEFEDRLDGGSRCKQVFADDGYALPGEPVGLLTGQPQAPAKIAVVGAGIQVKVHVRRL